MTTSSVGLTTNQTSNSSVDWDGITNYFGLLGNFSYANAYLNTYYVGTSKYTTAIRNGVATHEMGHALGLDHNSSTTSVMYPYTFTSSGVCARSNTPSTTDESAMASLYGIITLYKTACKVDSSLSTISSLNSIMFNNSSNRINDKINSQIDLSCKHYEVEEPSWSVGYTGIKDLADHSDLIVEGSISEENGTTYDTKGDFNNYYTGATMSVSQIIKGRQAVNGSDLKIKQLGGKDSDTQVISEDTTLLKKNDKVIIFLRKNSDNSYHPINEDEGIYMQNSNGKYVNIGEQDSQGSQQYDGSDII